MSLKYEPSSEPYRCDCTDVSRPSNLSNMAPVRQPRPWLSGKSPLNIRVVPSSLGIGVRRLLITAMATTMKAEQVRYHGPVASIYSSSLSILSNMAHIRQSRPDSGLGFQEKVR